MPNWHQYFIGLAQHASTRSKDPRTRVGAVAVDKDHGVIATGYNGFPYGVKDTPDNWENKDAFVVHAEENLIAHAARCRGGLKDATVYSTHVPCLRCARLLVQCGVAGVYYKHDTTTGYNGSWVAPQWPLIWRLFVPHSVRFARVTQDGMLIYPPEHFEHLVLSKQA